MKTSPKISVIFPVYNTPIEYMCQAIESILSQTFTDFECLILNDGSTNPDVEKTIKSYTDPRIKYFYHENMGAAGIRNYGLKLAVGEFIAIMDSDDIALPTRFAEQLAFFNNNPDVSLCGTWFEVFGDKSLVVKYPANVRLLDFLRGCLLGHSTVMWRRADFEKYNFYYNENYNPANDYELWPRAARCLKIANIEKVLLKYRWYKENLSNTYEKLLQDETKLIQKNILDFLTADTQTQKTIENAVRSRGYRWIGIPLLKIRYKKTKIIYRLLGFLPIYSKTITKI
jgi:glycosyltransferase involved in cell wall biosynthesis